mmetsp:Transcript_28612/g.55699  ORF Transcript_28612/g.55699 Transcript_28612/m.55699 type:complete len:345 (-) Transcript_28612:580-1614(-)
MHDRFLSVSSKVALLNLQLALSRHVDLERLPSEEAREEVQGRGGLEVGDHMACETNSKEGEVLASLLRLVVGGVSRRDGRLRTADVPWVPCLRHGDDTVALEHVDGFLGADVRDTCIRAATVDEHAKLGGEEGVQSDAGRTGPSVGKPRAHLAEVQGFQDVGVLEELRKKLVGPASPVVSPGAVAGSYTLEHGGQVGHVGAYGLERGEWVEIGVGLSRAVVVEVVDVVGADGSVGLLEGELAPEPLHVLLVSAESASLVHGVLLLVADETLSVEKLNVVLILVRPVALDGVLGTAPARIAESESLEVQSTLGELCEDVVRDVGQVLSSIRLPSEIEVVGLELRV